MTGNKTIVFVTILTIIFFVAVAFDLTPFLRGPAPYPPEWRWPYLFINTTQKIWFPLITILLIITFYSQIISHHEEYLAKYEKLILLTAVLCMILFQLSITYFSRSGIGVLIHRVVDPGLNGYFTASLAVKNQPDYLRKYNSFVLNLPMHAKGHPPGAILLTHYFTQVVSPLAKLSLVTKLQPRQTDVLSIWKTLSAAEKTSAILLNLFIAFLSSLSLIPLYYLTRFLYDKKTAVTAVFLFIFTPALTLFLPLYDVMYPLFSLLCVFTAIAALKHKNLFLAFLGGILLYVSSFFSLSILPVGVIIMYIYFLDILKSKKISNYLKLAAFYLTGLLISYTCFKVVWGYDQITVSHTLVSGLAHRSYWWWLIYNPYDFFIFSGVAASLLFIFNFFIIKKRQVTSFPLFIGFILMILILDVSGVYRAETGRVWLPFMPFLIVEAAALVCKRSAFNQKAIITLLALQAAQVLVIQEFWVPLW